MFKVRSTEYSIQRVLFQLAWLLLFPAVFPAVALHSCYFRSGRSCVPAGRYCRVSSALTKFGMLHRPDGILARQVLHVSLFFLFYQVYGFASLSLLFSGVISLALFLGIRRNIISHLA